MKKSLTYADQHPIDLHAIYSSFEAHHLILTDQRRAIIDHIVEQQVITDIEEHWIKVRQHAPVSWATMHLTIKLLVRIGWLTVLGTTNSQKKYLLNTNQIISHKNQHGN